MIEKLYQEFGHTYYEYLELTNQLRLLEERLNEIREAIQDERIKEQTKITE